MPQFRSLCVLVLICFPVLNGQTFLETFNSAPDYSNNWVSGLQEGSPTITYTPGNFQIQAPPVCTGPTSGTSVFLRSKRAFIGDLDVSFQLNHTGFGRTNVELWSVNQNQRAIRIDLDTDDTAYLNFSSGGLSTEYQYSSTPYMNKWISLRIQIVGSQVNFYADNGTGPQLLKTWPVPVTSPPDAYYIAFGAGSVCWKSGGNDTSFRRIEATGTIALPSGLLVTSANANSIFRYDNNGSFLQKFDNSSVQYPYGLALGPDGYLYTATTDSSSGLNSHIDRFDPVTGKRLASFGELPQTRGLAIGPDGLIYVSAFNARQIWRYNPTTSSFLDVVATIVAPYSFALDRAANLYVNNGSGTIYKVEASSHAVSSFISDPNLVSYNNEAMVFGPDGSLYVGTSPLSTYANQVRRYNGQTGAFDRVFAQDSHIGEAISLAFGPDGKVYMGTFFNGVLRFDGTTGAFIDTFIPAGSGGLGQNITGLLFLPPTQSGGTISVTSNLTSATFTITGPATYRGGGMSFTQANALAGQYTISYGTLTGYTTPPNETRTLIPGGIISFSATYQNAPDVCQAQVGTLQTQVATLQAQNASQAAQISQLNAQVSSLQTQVSTLSAQNTFLQNQVATLTPQNTTLQSQVNTFTTTLQRGTTQLQDDFRTTFNNSTFVVPGATLLQQYETIIAAIMQLNKGQKMGLYTNLGGKP